MNTPFSVLARCEHKNVEPSTAAAPTSRLWASIKIDPQGGGLERERAPLAVTLVVDTSGSMQGTPIEHVIRSCEILVDLLGERDQLAIVTFASHAAVRSGLTRVDTTGKTQLRRALHGIAADGNTNLHGGLEVAAGVLMTAPAGLRRAMVVMSDGRPNVGLSSAADLASYVTGLKLAVSSLGFGISHDEAVLDALATAGSGRYAYVPDPALARIDLARAALAHGGIVVDQLELKLEPADGVELVRLLPTSPLRVGGRGVTAPVGDVFVDEGRALAVELQLALGPHATGRLAAILISGRAPDGTVHRTSASLDVDIRTGPRIVDRDAQRDILLVRADAARADARAQADRGALPAAATILRQAAAWIDAIDGFVRNDGSLLAELREQLEDEIASYERKSSDLERVHQRKASRTYKAQSPGYTPAARDCPAIPAHLVGIAGPVAGQRFELATDNTIGRSGSNHIVVLSHMLSRSHTRIVFLGDHWMLQDLGATNGSLVNGKQVQSCRLADGDVIKLGDAELRFTMG
ncbi:MAG: VWA domain-containing protein [Deltaproteobacteria bacterium]|nr:MAG: VWA domain-containing protein [Deltaproteobacteria bacterium]